MCASIKTVCDMHKDFIKLENLHITPGYFNVHMKVGFMLTAGSF